MNDILIGAIIIIICVSVFILMSVLVVDSHNENKKMEEFNNKNKKMEEFNKKIDIHNITLNDLEPQPLSLEVTQMMDQWRTMLANVSRPTEQQELQNKLDNAKIELASAIDNEEYEKATKLRDEIQKLTLELKKYEKNI